MPASIEYQSFFQRTKWVEPCKNGGISGKMGSARLMQALQVRLANQPPGMQVVYDVKVSDSGWLGPVSNGTTAGNISRVTRYIEAVRIQLVNQPTRSAKRRVRYRLYSKQSQVWSDYVYDYEILTSMGGIEAIQIGIETIPFGIV
jgi:uncharacterized protein YjdB